MPSCRVGNYWCEIKVFQEQTFHIVPHLSFLLIFKGDLGSIDKRWDVAISTACPQLENILVETVDTAEECINFLKTHNVGRATFIALDQMQEYHRYANSTVRVHFSEYILSLVKSSVEIHSNSHDQRTGTASVVT